MFKNKFLWIYVLALFFIIEGCSKSGVNSPRSSNNTPQKIPFVIFLQNTTGQNSTNSDSGYVCRFDTTSGKISIEDTPLFRRIIQKPHNFRMIWDGDKKILVGDTSFDGSSFKLESLNPGYDIKELEPVGASVDKVNQVIKNSGDGAKVYKENNNVIVEFESGKKQMLNPPFPQTELLQPLLISGDEHNYRVLLAFDAPDSEGNLLIAVVKDGNIQWKKVRGEYFSFTAGAGSNLAQIGEDIYITGCGKVWVLNLQKNSPTLVEYKPVNDLLIPLYNKFQLAPIRPILGVYKGCLLVTVYNSNEKWLWILRDGVYLGGVHINTLNNQIMSTLDGKQIETKNLPSKDANDSLILPADGYGTWNP